MEADPRHPPTSVDPNLEHSIQIQQKFEFYFLALVFTILGLSIQTAQLSFWLQGILEIAGWLLLLTSGLVGLSRMEWIPVAYKGHSELVRRRAFLQGANTGRSLMSESGQIMSDAEARQFVKDVEDSIKEAEPRMERIKRRHETKTFIHKWFFVAGVALLMISRALGLWFHV